MIKENAGVVEYFNKEIQIIKNICKNFKINFSKADFNFLDINDDISKMIITLPLAKELLTEAYLLIFEIKTIENYCFKNLKGAYLDRLLEIKIGFMYEENEYYMAKFEGKYIDVSKIKKFIEKFIGIQQK